MFEWQCHSQDHTDVPDYHELLDFLNLRAQASEASTEKRRVAKPVNSLVVHTEQSVTCSLPLFSHADLRCMSETE